MIEYLRSVRKIRAWQNLIIFISRYCQMPIKSYLRFYERHIGNLRIISDESYRDRSLVGILNKIWKKKIHSLRYCKGSWSIIRTLRYSWMDGDTRLSFDTSKFIAKNAHQTYLWFWFCGLKSIMSPLYKSQVLRYHYRMQSKKKNLLLLS